jgi:outer membrane protein OmpA-like peptidoglycan-associated protein
VGLDGGGLTLVGSPTLSPLELSMSALWVFNDTPLRLGDRTREEIILLPAVDREHYLDLRVGFGIWEGVAISGQLPVLLSRDVTPDFQSELSPSGFGDLELRARYSPRSRGPGRLGLAAEGLLRVPTGRSRALLGSGGFGGGVNVAVDGQVGAVTPIVNLGYLAQARNQWLGLTEDDLLRYGLAARVELLPGERLTAIGEWAGSSTWRSPRPGSEVSVALATRFAGASLSAGGGGGLGRQAGTPSWRLFTGVSYTTGEDKADPDADGVLGQRDLCPALAEDLDLFQDEDGCPEADNDGDGVLDALDQCPLLVEDADNFRDNDGCPEADNDGDGIEDELDACANQAEDLDGWQDEDGCPDLDNDGDSLPDTIDQCPLEAETRNRFLDGDGCPDERPTYVFDAKVPVILYSIEFKAGSDELLEVSAPILDELARSMVEQPSIGVRVEGHTDDQGNDADNLGLSQLRALRVVNALINRGVDPRRLDYIGFGESRPLAPNKTEEGRAKNRRVEFLAIPGPASS